MNCKEAMALRKAYEGNTLPFNSSKAYQEHLLNCESCSGKLCDFDAIFSDLEDEPFDVKDSVMKAIQEQVVTPKRPAWIALFLRPAFAAGIVSGLLMLFCISSLFRSNRVPQVAQGEAKTLEKAVLLQDSRLVLRDGSLTLNGKRWQASMPGSEAIELYAKDHICTDKHAKGSLELGIAVLTLRPGLDFTVHRNKLAIKRGKTYVYLRRQGTEFKVTTPLLICAVRGTTLSVTHDDTGSSVSRLESAAEVNISFNDGFEVKLNDGETITVSSEGATSTTFMSEVQQMEILQEVAQATNKSVEHLGKQIVETLRAAGHTTGRVIDFFTRVIAGKFNSSTSSTTTKENKQGGGSSANMWEMK